MKSRKTKAILITLSALFLGFAAAAQTSGEIVFISSTTSPSLFFINLEKGELVSVATLDEQPGATAIDEANGIFYTLTHHYMYKGDLKSGEILDKYKFMDIIETTDNDATDPNLYIVPGGVTTDGYALVEFNSRKLEAARNLIKYTNELTNAEGDAVYEISKKSEENNEVYQKENKIQELHLIDFNNKSKTHYATYNSDEVMTSPLLAPDGTISIYDIGKQERYRKDIVNGQINQQVSYTGLFTQRPDLANHKIIIPPVSLANNISRIRFFDETTNKYIDISFNSETNEIVMQNEIDIKEITSQSGSLSYQNTDVIYFEKTECDIPPFPKMAELPKLEGSSKKKREEYMNQVNQIQEDYKKETADYLEKINNKANFCTLTIFKDQAMTQQLIAIPRTDKGTIINNDKVLVVRTDEAVLYDLNTGAERWTIDTNF